MLTTTTHHNCKQNLKAIDILLLYNPPTTSISTSMTTLTDKLEECKNRETYIFGDVNIDHIKYDNSRELLQLMSEYNFKQLIKQPTRTTTNSKTLIDCIYTNAPELNKMSEVSSCTISDHDLIYTIRKKQKTPKSPSKTIKIRCFKNTDDKKVKEMLTNAPWWSLELSKNVNDQYNMFEQILKYERYVKNCES